MKVFERWKVKKKIIKFKDIVWLLRIDKKLVISSVLSFTLGCIICSLRADNVKLSSKDFYFGDSPSFSLKSTSPDVFLIILVFSSINNFSRRETIRNTWLSDVGDNAEVKHFFAISTGTATEIQKSRLQNEQDRYNDLLIFTNLDDSFYLLTTKLITSFDWLSGLGVLRDEGKSSTNKNFQNFRYLLKCDDDSFVRVAEILHELKSQFPGKKGENLYWGFFDGRAQPKKAGKYKEDLWKLCDYYIPYALGGGYVLAYPLVHYIAKNGKFLTRYKSEDISVGAWLSTYAELNRVHDPRFDTEYISRGCHQSYLVTHKHSEVAMKNYHENLKNTGQLCQREFRTRISYNYNWKVPPSKCCARNNPDIP